VGKELNASWTPRREAFKEKASRRVSLVIRELLECTHGSLGDGELIADFVERAVSL
jgi:hypothetical protein